MSKLFLPLKRLIRLSGRLFFNLSFLIKTALRFLFSFLTEENTCVVCSSSTTIVPVCKKCDKEHFSLPEEGSEGKVIKTCSVCGKRLFSEKEKCMECRSSTVFKDLDGVFPLFSYRLWNMELLCRWKIEGERALSSFFAIKVYRKLVFLKEKLGCFSIVPVPPRRGKLIKEGWDQIRELSLFLENRYGLRIFRVLERKSSVQQKKLDRNGRLSSIGTSYSIKKGSEVLFKEKMLERVVVIDDVVTTGSTLEGIAGLLKKNGVKEVYGLTIFTVD